MSCCAEKGNKSVVGLVGIVPESYFVKRELRERPEPYASGELKRPRLGEGPKIHDIVSSELKKLRATLKSSAGSCLSPLTSFNSINSTQNYLHYSQSHDLQILLNKVSEIESKLESLRVEKKPGEVDEKNVLGSKHALSSSRVIPTTSNQSDSNNISKLPSTRCKDDESKKEIEELLTTCLCISNNLCGQNEINYIQKLLLKIKNTFENPTFNAIDISKSKETVVVEKKNRSKPEKRKFEWGQSDFEPMIQDDQINRAKLTPRKILFTFQPQNLMDTD
ncbi:unnamed protein product [Orchesella dallaii]|uniref:Uncharacterized protein n=1 Tax=Orchesella dallaii TaxID=48710 RepID=A0ABP1QXH9_9HEXA